MKFSIIKLVRSRYLLLAVGLLVLIVPSGFMIYKSNLQNDKVAPENEITTDKSFADTLNGGSTDEGQQDSTTPEQSSAAPPNSDTQNSTLPNTGNNGNSSQSSSQNNSTNTQQENTPTNKSPSYTIPNDAIIVKNSSELSSALSSAPVGSTIVLRAGTYTGISYTLSKRLTIEAYPDEEVWLDGQNSLQYAFFVVTNAGGTMIRGIGFKNYASVKNFSQKLAMVIIASSVTSGVTIESNTFQNSQSVGLSVQTNNSIVKNNVFKNNDWMGLHVNHADGILVEGNTFTGNNTGGNAISGTTAAAAGAKFTYTRGGTIKNNTFSSNLATGLWIDLQAADILVTGNTASNNSHHGIYYEVSTRGTITNNTIQKNSSYGIKLSGSNNTTVTGNTVSGNIGGNIFVQDDPRNTSNDSYCATGAAYGADCDSYANTVQ